jgi:hypothetical protein
MPYSRSYNSPYLGGSPYPTGRSPLVLDLENKINAVTQQIIDNRKQEIREKNLEINKNEKLIIDALDFEPLAEAGEKWQLENAKEIEGFTDRWTKKLYEQDYKLSTPDKIQLNKEKRDLERKRGVAETDIQTLAEIKKEIAKGEKSAYDVNETAQKVKEYQEKGLVGSGGAINLAVMKKIPFGATFKEKYEPMIKENAKTFIEDAQVLDRTTGETRTVRSNEAAINKAIEAIKTTPDYQELYEQNPEGAETVLNELKATYIKSPIEEKFVSATKFPTTKTTASQSSMFPDLKTQTQVEGATAFNEFAEKVWQGDEYALNEIKENKKYLSFVVEPDKIVFYDREYKGTPPEPALTLDKKQDKVSFKSKVWNYAPSNVKEGVDNIQPTTFIKENWDLAKPVQKAELAEVRNIRTLVNDIPEKYEKLNDFKKDQDKIVKELTDTILKGKYTPDDFDTNRGRYNTKPGITFNEITYDIRKPEQKEAFLNAVLKEAGMEQKKDEVNNPFDF